MGLIVTDEQAFGTAGSVTVGGLFMTTALVLLTVPQALVTANVTVYVPGFVKRKEGLVEVAVVLLVK